MTVLKEGCRKRMEVKNRLINDLVNKQLMKGKEGRERKKKWIISHIRRKNTRREMSE